MLKIKFTKKQEEEIINLYSKNLISIKNIATRYNLSKGPIKKLLLENGILIVNKTQFKKVYSLDEDFFEKIDSEEKAYFLGLLYADGYINERYNTCRISLQVKDIDILEKFNSSIKSNRTISFIDPPKKFPERSKLASLTITNKNFYKNLVVKGCVNKKSFILDFPNESTLPKELHNHFIRGYFDGDGSIYKSNNKFSFELTGTENFIEKCQKILMEELNFNKTSIYFKNPEKNTCRVRYSGNRQCIKVRDWLYKKSSVFLDRKKAKFDEIIASV